MKLLEHRTCDRFSSRLSSSVDAGAIDLQLRRHVRTCARCRRELHQYRRLRGILRSLPSHVPLPNPNEAARARRLRLVLSGAAGGLGLVSVAVAMGTRRRSH